MAGWMKCPSNLNRRMMRWMKCPSSWMMGQIQGKLLSSFTICNFENGLGILNGVHGRDKVLYLSLANWKGEKNKLMNMNKCGMFIGGRRMKGLNPFLWWI
jgi:hypothetical protein